MRKYSQKLFASPDFERLAAVTVLGREVPFLYPMAASADEGPQLMRGVIDLLYESKSMRDRDYKQRGLLEGRSLGFVKQIDHAAH